METTGSKIPSRGSMTNARPFDHAIIPALVRQPLTAAVLRMTLLVKGPACVPVIAREGFKAAHARLKAKPVGKMKGVTAFACTESVTPISAEAVVLRGVPRRTLLGHSTLLSRGGLSGWGLYMGEPIKKGDYIGEYVGEVVSREEGERRGLIYDKRNLSYLFDLNITQTLDSTRVGNKFRYINHQADPHANCRAKILLCNQVHRIGMFACQNMSVGDEILFDYGETFTSRFDLIKLDGNKQPKLERKRIGDIKKVPAANGKVTAKKSGGQIGRPRKKVMLDPDFKSHRSSHQSPSKDEDEIIADVDDVEPVKASRKRRRSALVVDLDAGNEMADTPLLEEGLWELSSSESYHESEGEDENSEEEEEGEEEEEEEEEEMDDTTTPPPPIEEVKRRDPQQRGWDTRHASIAKRPAQMLSRPEVVGVKHEVFQKRGSKTRQDRQAKDQAQGQIIRTARKSSGRGILD
ncbi:MAG: hypothetical protein Q9187_001753 [Circinaria calcarea]